MLGVTSIAHHTQIAANLALSSRAIALPWVGICLSYPRIVGFGFLPKGAEIFLTFTLSCSKSILICQNRSCRKQGAAKVLAAFQASEVPGVTVTGSQCLGQCGNGPMVVVMPEEVWYNDVHPDEVPTVIERHLRGGKPVAAMLYGKFHQRS